MALSSSLQRREFLARTAAAGAVGLVGLADVSSEAAAGEKPSGDSPTPARSTRELSAAHFRPLIGQRVLVSGVAGSAAMMLVDVRGHDQSRDAARPVHVRQESFALLFQAPSDVTLNAEIQQVEHPQVGQFDLFMHEVAANVGGPTRNYEIVFN
jgi:hypothetical protein